MMKIIFGIILISIGIVVLFGGLKKKSVTSNDNILINEVPLETVSLIAHVENLTIWEYHTDKRYFLITEYYDLQNQLDNLITSYSEAIRKCCEIIEVRRKSLRNY